MLIKSHYQTAVSFTKYWLSGIQRRRVEGDMLYLGRDYSHLRHSRLGNPSVIKTQLWKSEASVVEDSRQQCGHCRVPGWHICFFSFLPFLFFLMWAGLYIFSFFFSFTGYFLNLHFKCFPFPGFPSGNTHPIPPCFYEGAPPSAYILIPQCPKKTLLLCLLPNFLILLMWLFDSSKLSIIITSMYIC